MQSAGHGPNIGHGFVKYVLIDRDGVERAPLVFPALIARVDAAIAGALTHIRTVTLGGEDYWTGEDALYAPPRSPAWPSSAWLTPPSSPR